MFKAYNSNQRFIKGSSQIHATYGTTDIPHGYSAWHSVFDSDSKSIYTAPWKPYWDAAIRVLKYIKGSLGQGLLLPSENNLTLTAYCDSDGRLSDNSEISIWVLHFSWFFYYLMEVKKTNKSIKIICGSRIPCDDQYLFGDSLVTISVAELKGVM